MSDLRKRQLQRDRTIGGPDEALRIQRHVLRETPPSETERGTARVAESVSSFGVPMIEAARAFGELARASLQAWVEFENEQARLMSLGEIPPPKKRRRLRDLLPW